MYAVLESAARTPGDATRRRRTGRAELRRGLRRTARGLAGRLELQIPRVGRATDIAEWIARAGQRRWLVSWATHRNKRQLRGCRADPNDELTRRRTGPADELQHALHSVRRLQIAERVVLQQLTRPIQCVDRQWLVSRHH